MKTMTKIFVIAGMFIIMCLLISIVAVSCNVIETSGNNKSKVSAVMVASYRPVETSVKNSPAKKDVSSKKTNSVKPVVAKQYVFGAGNYISGKAFEAGTYDIQAVSGSGNVCSSNMWDGGLNETMATQEDNLYVKEFKGAKLPAGTTLTIMGMKVKLVKTSN
jgi:hypothetical protein